MTRTLVGLLVPSSNTVMEPDFYRGLPATATVHTGRMLLEETTPEAEAVMLDEHTIPAARDLATIHPDLVVFGCTSAGALRGNASEAELVRRIAELAAAPALSVMASVRAALATLGARRVALLTPYVEALTERIALSLAGDGFEVVARHGMGIWENAAIALVEPLSIVEFARSRLRGVRMDAVFVSCTNLRAVEALDDLRRTLGVPVLCSNQAVLDATVASLRQLAVSSRAGAGECGS